MEGGINHVVLGSLFTPSIRAKLSPMGFWCWPDLVDRPVGGKHVNQHLPDSIVRIILSSSAYALNIVKTIMYHSPISTSTSTGMAMTSYSTYSLPCSRIGPMPSSSASRYGFSIDYTDPYLSRQQLSPTWVSCPNPGTSSRPLPVRENTGLVTLSNAGAPSACTATRPARMPTPQGSNAPVRKFEEGGYLAPFRQPIRHEPELSLGGDALEDWQMRVRAHLDGLPRSASVTPGPHAGCHAPSFSHSTQRGYAPAGTDLYSQGTVRNKALSQ